MAVKVAITPPIDAIAVCVPTNDPRVQTLLVFPNASETAVGVESEPPEAVTSRSRSRLLLDCRIGRLGERPAAD
jgi:hypothetical protein